MKIFEGWMFEDFLFIFVVSMMMLMMGFFLSAVGWMKIFFAVMFALEIVLALACFREVAIIHEHKAKIELLREHLYANI